MATQIFSASLDGVEDLRRRIRQAGELARKEVVMKAAEAMADKILPKVLARVPVDKGILRDALELKVVSRRDGEAQATIGADPRKLEARGRFRDGSGKRAPYDRFVEYGTERTAAQPFLRPPLDEGGQEAADAAFLEFEVALDELGERQ